MSFRLPTLLFTALGVAVGLSATPSAFGGAKPERGIPARLSPRAQSESLRRRKEQPRRSQPPTLLVRSQNGVSWTTPTLIYAHAIGGSQDPCLLQISDGSLLYLSYGWTFLRPDGVKNLKPPFLQNYPGSIFTGGHFLRSVDHAQTWLGPFYPPISPPRPKSSFATTAPPPTSAIRGPCNSTPGAFLSPTPSKPPAKFSLSPARFCAWTTAA